MMADEQYELRPQRTPDPTEKKPHPHTFRISVAALSVALVAALFSGWQALEAHKSRLNAEASAKAQLRDVERARKAAEESSSAAKEMASTMRQDQQLRLRSRLEVETKWSAQDAQTLYFQLTNSGGVAARRIRFTCIEKKGEATPKIKEHTAVLDIISPTKFDLVTLTPHSDVGWLDCEITYDDIFKSGYLLHALYSYDYLLDSVEAEMYDNP